MKASPLARADLSLDGLSLGDAFGERFFGPPDEVLSRIARRALPPAPWTWTDDTAMGCGVREVLAARGEIDRELLARVFARRYRDDRHRGYGAAAHEILEALGHAEPWQVVSRRPFEGTGSKGNGGAMRAAPVGAFFAGAPARVVAQARASAEVTHAHPEGIAGAIAVALAASWAVRREGDSMLQFVLRSTPPGPTRLGLEQIAELGPNEDPRRVAGLVGAGQRVLAEDTVPFALWCASAHLGSFEEAMWCTVSGLGDRDTTCAIVGGIVALAVGREGLPATWLAAREPLREH